MTEPPYGDTPPRRDAFAPAPRPRPRREPPTEPPFAAYPSLPQPGSYGDHPQVYGEPVLPPYSPPGYAPQPYSPPGYAPLGYAPYGYPAVPPAPLAPPRRRWPWVTLLVAAVAIVGVVVWLVLKPSTSSPQKVALPESFAGYTKLSGQVAQATINAAKAAAGANPSAKYVFDRASLGVYSKDSGEAPGLVAIVLPASAIQGRSTDPMDLFQGFQQLGITIKDFPAGAHGGSLECGSTSIFNQQITLCAWVDSSTAGLIEAIRPVISLSATASASNELRAAID